MVIFPVVGITVLLTSRVRTDPSSSHSENLSVVGWASACSASLYAPRLTFPSRSDWIERSPITRSCFYMCSFFVFSC
ncbi:hypothetical protein E2C01_091830 [Portunus trituberculatus]|uniref:Secreted protein n=1 Tax=Portunus trituberculatus TaxID=210409 RepID=A0A5B7JQF5_PORTR|nr:hypothetical protein [Portunus trituberculatus]